MLTRPRSGALLVLVATFVILQSSIYSFGQAKMPAADAGKVLSVAPGQTIFFEVVRIVRDPIDGKQTDRGISLWQHAKGTFMAFWGTYPQRDSKWDVHGGLVNPTIGGLGGSYRWTNEGTATAEIFVNAWSGQSVLESKPIPFKFCVTGSDNEFMFYAGEDGRYDKITLKVKLLKP